MADNNVYTIGIGGGSGSGKTTLAKRLAALLPGFVRYISCDNYYKPIDGRDARTLNFDVPDAIDYERLKADLKDLADGKSVPTLRWKYQVGRFVDENVRVEPAPIVILEGILVFSDDELSKMLDLKLFVDTPADLRLLRRMKRDIAPIEEGGRGLKIEEEFVRYEQTVTPAFEKYVAPGKAKADLIVSGDSYAKIDAFVNAIEPKLRALAKAFRARREAV